MATLYDLFNQNQVETNSFFSFANISKPHLCWCECVYFFFSSCSRKFVLYRYVFMEIVNACEYFHLKLSKFVFGKYHLECKLCVFEWFLLCEYVYQCWYCGFRKSIPEKTVEYMYRFKGKKYLAGRIFFHVYPTLYGKVKGLLLILSTMNAFWIDTDKGNDLKFTGLKTENLC